ncbi:MAG: DUF4058 family protein [Planctomycetes bacterium]|nr:DUF4058 family protein [Planctomycetota bacterium]
MPSPFPGMNPYLEQPSAWQDSQTRFISLAAELLGAQVLPKYYVKIDEQPDLSVHPVGNGQASSIAAPGLLTAPSSVGMPVVVEEERLAYLEIIDRVNRKVVTVLELLSPSNKQVKSDRDQYRAKVQRILASGTNFVEIDLLRGGSLHSGNEGCSWVVIARSVSGKAYHKKAKSSTISTPLFSMNERSLIATLTQGRRWDRISPIG